ncbi:glycoside hydrolase family protein [Candidatus Darwinibacter acetoxidans]
MGLPDLYPAQVGSPYTTLAAPYTTGEATMTVVDATKLPDAPNIVCLAGSVAGEFRYSEKDGNTLLGVVKLPGTLNTIWPVGTYAFRGIAAYDLNAIHENMVRTATYVVAASDAPDHVKRQADYVCDGVDDHVEIQAAIDALPTYGGTVYVTGGTYQCRKTITFPSYTRLKLEKGASIYVPDDHALTVFTPYEGPFSALITNADHAAGNTGIVIEGGYIDFMAGEGATHTKSRVQGWAGIWLHNCTNSRVSDAIVENVVYDVDWTYARAYGILLTECTYCVVVDCEGNEVGYEGIGIRVKCEHIRVIRCKGFRCRQHAMQVCGWAPTPAPAELYDPRHITFEDCCGNKDILAHGGVGRGMRDIAFIRCHSTESSVRAIGDIKNILFRDCYAEDTKYGVYIGTTGIDGEVVDGVTIDGFYYRHGAGEFTGRDMPIHIIAYTPGSLIRNIKIINGYFEGGTIAGFLDGGRPGVVFENIEIRGNVQVKPLDVSGFVSAAVHFNLKNGTTEVRNLSIRSNHLENLDTLIHFHADGPRGNNASVHGTICEDNDMTTVSTLITKDAPEFEHTFERFSRNLGYVTENKGATTLPAGGGTIAHGCAATPTVATVSGSVAGEIVTVTSIDATNITVAIKKPDGGAGTAQTVYWRAEV